MNYTPQSGQNHWVSYCPAVVYFFLRQSQSPCSALQYYIPGETACYTCLKWNHSFQRASVQQKRSNEFKPNLDNPEMIW